MQRVTTGQSLRFWMLIVCIHVRFCVAADIQDEVGTLWKYDRSDCQPIFKRHSIEPSSETMSGFAEHIQIRAGAGTHCYVFRTTEKSHIIADYDARIRIRSDRIGITTHAKIVFPHVIDMLTNGPVSVLIQCDQYDQPGSWQELRITGLAKRINEHVRYVRQKYGSSVDVSNAYIAGHVLNIFGGPGTTNVWIGESHTTGSVSIDSVRAGPVDATQNQRISPVVKRPRATIDNGLLRLGENLFIPRVLEYRGEPLSMVAKLGFNTIALTQLPNREFLEDVERHNLWVICPPPLQSRMNSTQSLDRVVFWDLGQLKSVPSPGYSEAIARLRLDDPRQRLLVCGCDSARKNGMESDGSKYVARFADIVVRESRSQRDDSTVSRFDKFYSDAESTGPHRLTWAKIATSDPLFQQSGVELVLAIVAGGANGVWFQSHQSLNDNDTETQLRRITIEAANLKLQSIRPWVVGVGQRRVIARISQPMTRVVRIVANDAALLILVRNSSDSNPVVVTSPTRTESSDAFQLLPTGLRPLKSRRVSGGLAITLNDADPASPIVVTENRLATNQLARFTSATRHRSIAIQHALAEASVRLAESGGTTKGSAHTARQFFDRGRDLLKSGDSTNAYHAFQDARRELYRR